MTTLSEQDFELAKKHGTVSENKDYFANKYDVFLSDIQLAAFLAERDAAAERRCAELMAVLKFVVETFEPIKKDLVFGKQLALTKAASAIAKAEQS